MAGEHCIVDVPLPAACLRTPSENCAQPAPLDDVLGLSASAWMRAGLRLISQSLECDRSWRSSSLSWQDWVGMVLAYKSCSACGRCWWLPQQPPPERQAVQPMDEHKCTC